MKALYDQIFKKEDWNATKILEAPASYSNTYQNGLFVRPTWTRAENGARTLSYRQFYHYPIGHPKRGKPMPSRVWSVESDSEKITQDLKLLSELWEPNNRWFGTAEGFLTERDGKDLSKWWRSQKPFFDNDNGKEFVYRPLSGLEGFILVLANRAKHPDVPLFFLKVDDRGITIDGKSGRVWGLDRDNDRRLCPPEWILEEYKSE